jgi:hypothetical protein
LEELLEELNRLSEKLDGLGKNVAKLSAASERLRAETTKMKRK